ncbi:ArsR family transcriptional regulator [Haloferax mediterranei ATCC 33500]|uniref:ArsR family transcriptional regulator n=1 Tax=Haloferax mediterranei (strain ATCC 33500 / DSM 1411 / JCM 8866 / NBRC 14739 / NCIMB 2177 / R-4) TaxID=523841 RepID=I3R1S8_HALMT|nr:helix-turn-helix domain-containing protein [Haloferax mediterranei]AFK18188.1 putative transcriptional regulator, ArsR family [Haloferax mediterranei ATCC 33500]AHZ22405.1 ArsR family transcriptional regulator [Haloferax mediterranei ATCC 33500]EMA02538.1 ArsR family transcriptional regulator [Haloferax mediterranei ATCC 33500]MDX5988278.1 helix-turn-helix domain-containing protein [Haloferax mediterranei ATCC 33500]QCQ74716.1 ArsR family transcriptional regulator [Haloferax mediterranei AT
MNTTSTLIARGGSASDSHRQDRTDSSAVLSVLSDDDSRRILAACDEAPRTAQECADVCDVPLSTVYRKLDQLTEASLLDERRRIQLASHHPREFETNFDTLSFSFADAGVAVDFRNVATDGGKDAEERRA